MPGRIVLGLPFVLFIPGYTLVFFLFPGKDISVKERIALSFGLSITVVPLIGFGFNYTSWGIRVVPIIAGLNIVVLALAAIGWYRWLRLPVKARWILAINITWPQTTSTLDKALNVGLIAAIVISLSLLVYVVVTPNIEEPFTELYLLGPQGKAADYPTNLAVKNNGTVIVGIINHEYRRMEYVLEGWLINYSFDLQFDGKDDYVEVSSSPSLNITDAITIEAWVKRTTNLDCGNNSGWQWVFRKSGAWDVIMESQKPVWRIAINGTLYRWAAPTSPWPLDEWIHVAWTYESEMGIMTTYFNGIKSTHYLGVTGPLDACDTPLIINFPSEDVHSHNFPGTIRNLRIYNRVLSEYEIQQNYYATDEKEVITTDLISWWKMNEGQGNITEDHVGLNNGTIHGATWVNSGIITNMWFVDSSRMTLNHTDINIEKNWTAPWESPYSFWSDRTGTYKVAFLLFKNHTDEFIKGKDYPEEAGRRLQAYREVHLWIVVKHPPVANFIYAPSRPTTSDIVTCIDTSYVRIGGENIVNWSWDFGDNHCSFGDTALVFDGIDDYVDCGVRPSFDITTNCTFDFWFKPHDLTKSYSRIIRKNGAYSIHLSPTAGALRLQEYSNGSFVDSDAVFNENEWQHVTLVKNGSQVQWYRNGVNAGEGTLDDRAFPSARASLYLGLDEDLSSKAFNGSLKEVRMYDRGLNATEIECNYYDNITKDGLLHWWKFSIETGNLAYDVMKKSWPNVHGPSRVNIAAHHYSESGTYEVSLTVRNADGLTDTFARELVIE